EEWTLSFIADNWSMGYSLDESDSYSGGTVTYSVDDMGEYDGGEYYANDDYVDSYDAYYESTYSPRGAWLDDTRPDYVAPHSSHAPGKETRADWLAALALDPNETRGYDEWVQAMARIECDECLDY